MGTQAKYYQVIKGKEQIAVKFLKVDEDFYNTLNDTEIVTGKIDIDNSYNNLPKLLEHLSGNSELGKLAFFGKKIESENNYECPVQFINRKLVAEIADVMSHSKIEKKDEFIRVFNETQEAPYDRIQYKNLLDGYWFHYNAILEFYSECKIENSAVLVLIS
ncbi:MAG: DUF1877 family protein [Saprospiraceae bacterium]